MFAVLAFGNPLRRDDGAALEAARGLSGWLPALDVLTAHQLLPEHAETVARSQGVVFVDAREGGTPGEVTIETVEEERALASMTSRLDVREAILAVIAEWRRSDEGRSR